MSHIERWTMCRRLDWPEREGNPWVVPTGVDPPYPDSELEVFEVERVDTHRGATTTERERWLRWASAHNCCEAGLRAAPDPCPWHDAPYGGQQHDDR